MALGNNYSANTDNNKKNNKIDISEIYVSAYNMSSPEGLDPSALSYSYTNNGFLRITITPLKFDDPNDRRNYRYDRDNATYIMLSPTKAEIFAREIKNLIANPDTINNVGVCTTSKDNCNTYIIFSNGKEFGIDTPCLIIRKADEAGNPVSTYGYQFKQKDSIYSIKNITDSNKFERIDYPTIEVDNLILILERFYSAMSGAQTYSNIYYGRFENNKIIRDLSRIMEKLGIQTSNEYNRMGRGGNTTSSFFGNPNNASSITTAQQTYSNNLLEEDYN